MKKSGILTREEWKESVNKMWSDAVEDSYKDLLKKAILEEREAIAEMVSNFDKRSTPKSIAAAIRLLGK